MKNLKSLIIWFNETVANINDYFKLKAKSFPKLEELTFSTKKEKDKISGELIRGLKGLKTFCLTGFYLECEKFGSSSYLFKNMSDFFNLTSLSLSRFPDNFHLNESFLEDLIHLEQLSLFADPNCFTTRYDGICEGFSEC